MVTGLKAAGESPAAAVVAALLAHFLGDLEFDGQAVAIPARDVRGAEAAQGFVFDDDVLEDFVQRGADVDVAVGEGRAVVQDEFGRGGAGGLDFLRRGRRPAIFARRSGSRATRSAFMGKPVCGRFNVSL